MVCQSCGNAVQGGFCSQCGTRVLGMPPAPPPQYGAPRIRFERRVERHVHTLGLLWCVYGLYRAVNGVFAALFLMHISTRGVFAPWGPVRIIPFMAYNPWMRGAASFLAMVAVIGAIFSLAVGFSLMRRKRWGRILAIVLGILVLLRVPIGTGLGIYTLWVLAPSASGEEYDELARY